MTAGALAVRSLERHGVEVVFGIPGTPQPADLRGSGRRRDPPRHAPPRAGSRLRRRRLRPRVRAARRRGRHDRARRPQRRDRRRPGLVGLRPAAADRPGHALRSPGRQHRLPARDARPAPRAERGRGARGASRNARRAVPRAGRRVRLLRRRAAAGTFHRGSARPARGRRPVRAGAGSAARAALACARRGHSRREHAVESPTTARRRGRGLPRRGARARGVARPRRTSDDDDQRQGRRRRAPPARAGGAATGRRGASDCARGRCPRRRRLRPRAERSLEHAGARGVRRTRRHRPSARLTATFRPASRS